MQEEVSKKDSTDSRYKRISQRADSTHSLYKKSPQRQTVQTRCTRGSRRDRQYRLAVQEDIPDTDSTDTMYKRKSQRQDGHDVQE